MTKQKQINHFIEKLKENGKKFAALEKRRKQCEFPSENIDEFRKYEQLRGELTKEWIEIGNEIEAAGLREYFAKNVEGF